MWDKRARVIDVHDGDTVTVVLDQGFGDTKQMNLRMLGTFAPELRQPGGIETREFVTRWLAQYGGTGSWPIVCTSARMPVADADQSTLGRYVGTITSPDGTANLNAAVNEFVRANGYGGGTGAKVISLTARLRRRWTRRAAA